MKRIGGLFALGLLALPLQSVLARFLPPPACPDLGLLVVIGIGLCLRSMQGLWVCALLGYATDLLSLSLLGQHAFLRVLLFGATRVGSRHLNLMRMPPRLVFVAMLTVATGLVGAVLTRLFVGTSPVDWVFFRDLILHALVTTAFALPVTRIVEWLNGRLASEEDAPHRPMRLDAGRRRA